MMVSEKVILMGTTILFFLSDFPLIAENGISGKHWL